MGPLLLALGLLWAAVAGQLSSDEPKPEFLAPLENMTAVQGREVTFTCVVNHLGLYKVAWIKSDSKAILAIHTHLVAHNPRLSVTHNGHNTWKLHVSNVQRNDSGSYMCQVNTDPMTSQMGYLDVVVPPDILSDAGTDAGTAPEGGSVRLRCEATGVPDPSVVWRREDGKDIIIRPDIASQRQAVRTFEGETLVLSGVQRTDMGIYFCIASNGVPPSVSKRFTVNVNFQPMVKVSNQLVAAPIGSNVTIQCYVEASPRAMTSWHKDSGGKLMDGMKYATSETPLSSYSLLMHLTISNLELRDFGTYTCTAVNAIGKGDGGVRLQELQLPPKTTTAATNPFGKLLPPPTPSRKKQGPHVKDPGTSHKRKKPRPKNEKRPPDYDDSFGDDEDNNLLPMGVAPTTPVRKLVLPGEATLAPHTPPRSNPRNTPSSAVAPTRLPVLVLVYSAWACI